MNDIPRPFSDIEYSLLVLNALKRSTRKSEIVMQWIPPRSFLSPEPDRREVAAALDLAIEALQQHMRGSRQ